MNPRLKLLLLAGVSVCLLIGAVWFNLGREPSPASAQRDNTIPATPAVQPAAPTPTSPAGTQPSRQEQENAMTQFLNTMKESLKKAGVKETPAVAEQLRQAVASKDHGEIVRAFHEAIYGRYQKMSEVLPAVKSYLAEADPFVRLTAARTLYTAGDGTGYETLQAMVTVNEAIPEGKQDLRMEAAHVLAKFREVKAADGIIDLYSQTKDGELLSALATLGIRAPEAKQFPFVSSKLAITEYGKVGASELVPMIASTFEKTTDPKVKCAAAWALARFGQEGYENYLAQMAQSAINAELKENRKFNESAAALRYLGSLQSPLAKQVLEQALDSNHPMAVRYAVVNLLFNQPVRSEIARQVVIRELRGEQNKLGTELMLNIAAKLDDPEVRAAGEAFDQRSGSGGWKLQTTERRQWPIYNWIDNYVIALK
jgi:HEAT repeat protein